MASPPPVTGEGGGNTGAEGTARRSRPSPLLPPLAGEGVEAKVRHFHGTFF